MTNAIKLTPAVHHLSSGRQELELVSMDDPTKKWSRVYESGLALWFDADQLGLLQRSVSTQDDGTRRRASLKNIVELDDLTLQRYRLVAA